MWVLCQTVAEIQFQSTEGFLIDYPLLTQQSHLTSWILRFVFIFSLSTIIVGVCASDIPMQNLDIKSSGKVVKIARCGEV